MAHSGAMRPHAIVIGASMAGMMAARVLANHFERVTVIERDHLPADPVFRAGVPQGRHPHVLLMQGHVLFQKYFPGFVPRLQEHGGRVLDFGDDLYLNVAGNWLPRFHQGLPFYGATRNLMEWSVREELKSAFPSISFIAYHNVTGLVADAPKAAITGVQILERGAGYQTRAPETLAADLVVDASGRHSLTPQWLRALGYAPPVEEMIDAHTGYASRLVTLPESATRGWESIYLMADPPRRNRGGLILAVENGLWLAGIVGAGGDAPPVDEAGFLAFAESLPSPEIATALKEATAVTPIVGYRDTRNLFHHYETMRRFPEGFIVLGDAVAAFNPVYGQGMTVAMMDAAMLDRLLQREQGGAARGFPRRFQRALAKQVAVPWQLSTSSDAVIPGAEGKPADAVMRFSNAYLRRVFTLMPRNRRAHLTFVRVMHLTAPPTAFFHPAILSRAIVTSGK